MPDITIKSMASAAPSPMNSGAAPAKAPAPANGAAKGAANAEGPETSAPSANQPAGFANALQRHLDKQSAGAETSAPDDTVVPADDAAAVSATTPSQAPMDLSALLGALQAAPAQPQSVVGAATPLESQVAAAPLAIPATGSSGYPAIGRDQVTEEVLQPEPTVSANAPTDKPAVVAASDGMKLQTLAASAEESKQKAVEAQYEGMPAVGTDGLHAAPNAITRPTERTQSELPSLQMQTPLKAPGWQDELGQKLTLLVGREQHRAEIVLNPPQLGRVEVSLTVSNDQASAQFVAATPAAREALEQAVPRLREVLAEAGIALGQTSVNEHSAQEKNHGGEGEPRRLPSGAMPAPTDSGWLRRSEGLVDTFA